MDSGFNYITNPNSDEKKNLIVNPPDNFDMIVNMYHEKSEEETLSNMSANSEKIMSQVSSEK